MKYRLEYYRSVEYAQKNIPDKIFANYVSFGVALEKQKELKEIYKYGIFKIVKL